METLTIKTTALDYRRFNLDYVDPDPTIGDWGWAQRPYIAEIERQYNSGKPVRIIVLKARQLGISTATEAVLFLWSFIHEGSNGLVISHQDGQAQELYEMTRTYWETWPFKYMFEEKYKTRRQLRWTETGSQIRVATAKNPEGLRGSTIQALHASEVAFWADADTLWTGLNNTIPFRHGTIAVLESTANGVGNWFHQKWEEAVRGENEFTPMFFPWYKHGAYRLHNTLHRVDLDSDERELLRLMTSDPDGALTTDDALAGLAWRRWKIPVGGGVDKFHQEFPSTPHEAFITSGNPIFEPAWVERCYDPQPGLVGRLYKNGRGGVSFEHDATGDLKIFKAPSTTDVRADKYFVTADPSENRHQGDPACIQVINRSTNEQVAVWHAHADPVVVARLMMLLGDFYHHAMLCPEAEGGGQATIGAILQSGYDNVWSWKKPDRTTASFNVWGWSTNYNTKLHAITTLQNLIHTDSVRIHDELTYFELLNFVEHPNGQMGNSSNSPHDDTVMSLAIAVCASKMQGHFKPQQSHHPVVDIFSSEFESNGGGDSIDNIIPIRRIKG